MKNLFNKIAAIPVAAAVLAVSAAWSVANRLMNKRH
jgi:hypothetical protein